MNDDQYIGQTAVGCGHTERCDVGGLATHGSLRP